MAAPGGFANAPVIVLTTPRSGSTLLRVLLDAHPVLACPAETSIVRACAQLASAWSVTNEAGGEPVPLDRLPERAYASIRRAVDDLFGDYLRRRGKTRWCDKSLDTVPVAGWFLNLYPEARFICLYRHWTGVVNSGLEASLRDLAGCGLEQVAGSGAASPASALSACWTEHAGRVLEFEKLNADRCLRVHYERLIIEPEAVAAEVFDFLGVARVPGITSSYVSGRPPGNANIPAPVPAIPRAQLGIVNHLLGEMGYLLAGGSAVPAPSARTPAVVPANGRLALSPADLVTRAVLARRAPLAANRATDSHTPREPSGPDGWVRARRVAAGLTQEELAQACGLSVRAISDIERGVTARPRPSSAALLEAVLGVLEEEKAAGWLTPGSPMPRIPARTRATMPGTVNETF